MATTLNWDKSTDIVVVGFGYAGAVAALEADKLGAKVILLEKKSHPGGLSIFAGGGFRFADDAELAFKYFKRTCLNTTPDPVLRSMAVGFTQVLPFLKGLAAQAGLDYIEKHNTGGTYRFEGGETFGHFKPKENPAFERYSWLRTHGAGWTIFKILEEQVRKSDIEIMMSTPFRRLLTGEGGEVVGCVAQQDGREVTIKARKAVILTCGGFEHNQEMKLQFFQAQPVYAACPSGNEGDGIRAAQKVGAKLWHMWHIHGSYGFKHPELPVALRHRFSGGRDSKGVRIFPWIIVNRLGKRYMNEQPIAPQDSPWRAMSYYDTDLQDYPNIPSYMLLDEDGVTTGPIFVSYYTDYDDAASRYEWSSNNLEEVRKGWIKKGSSIETLATTINIDPEILKETVSRWNRICEDRVDHDFHRPEGSMAPISKPPFYAVEVLPIISNTQGGLAHDPAHRVLDSLDNPIKRLYAAGEITSIFGHLYLQSGNASECLVGGKIVGENAAQEEPWDG
ncbi:MAG: FAD-binding protein [Thaumarchaeota archaeon]|nr:FAD-binding protein [Nitrososphaerota archaeon]